MDVTFFSKPFWSKLFVPATVFITGAMALVIEIVGMRILSPFFGSTMFTTSSVISVFLAALSLGYYWGGLMADKQKSSHTLFTFISLAGLATVLVVVLKYTALPYIGKSFSIATGPLVSSVLFFALPGIFLGMVSPFAIALQQQRLPQVGVGKIAGEIFFWSTLGSILGSLGSGFLLLPNFSIDQIMIGVGICLQLLGWVNLREQLMKKQELVWLLAGGLLMICGAISLSRAPKSKEFVYSHEGVYQTVNVIATEKNNQPANVLYLDLNQSGAAYLNSSELTFDYNKYVELYRVLKPDAKRALFIGGGAYTLPDSVIKINSNIVAEVVEIEPELLAVGQQFFQVQPNPRLKNIIADGRRYLRDTDQTYDLIFSDAYLSLYSVPTHLTTLEFFEEAKKKLHTDGVFMANIIGSLADSEKSFLWSEMKTFRAVFPNSYFLAMESPELLEIQNFVFVGVNNNQPVEWESQQFITHPNPIIANASKHLFSVPASRFDKHIIFTDNFAPVDSYMMQLLADTF